MQKINTANMFVQSNQKLWFLPPLYSWFGQLDNAQSINSLNEKNQKIIWDLQEILVNKNSSNTNRLYVADLGITTILPHLERNNIELKKLYTWVIKELKDDFDVQLLSTTDLAKVMAKFFGVESWILPKEQFKNHLKKMHHYSVKTLHEYLDQLYQDSILYTWVNMRSNFEGIKWNTVEIIK